MAQCPLCAAEIAEDFGLIECANCSAQLIVHMDGRVEYSGGQESPSDPEPIQGKIEEVGADFEFGEPPQEFEAAPTRTNLPSESVEDLPDIGSIIAEELEEEKTVALPPESEDEVLENELSENQAGEHEVAESVTRSFLKDLPASVEPDEPPFEEERPAPPAPKGGTENLADIARFGNSEASSLRDGPLRYNIFISGIDTADVREAFREAITDRKLVWDIEQILRSVRNGEVRLENVTPPKAHMVLSRLRNLPVQVEWEQYAISQT